MVWLRKWNHNDEIRLNYARIEQICLNLDMLYDDYQAIGIKSLTFSEIAQILNYIELFSCCVANVVICGSKYIP